MRGPREKCDVYEWISWVEWRFFFEIIIGIMNRDRAPTAYLTNTTCFCKVNTEAACFHWNNWGYRIIASVEQMKDTGSGSRSSLASYSYVESFAFGQLFISPFLQTTHCKMRDWKNIAEKYHRENIKVKNNNGKSSVFFGFQLLHPHLLACYEYYYFLWPSLNNARSSQGPCFHRPNCLFL